MFSGSVNHSFFFDTMVHLGTLFAVVMVMWKEILDLFRKPFYKLLYLIIATIPAVVFALLFQDFFESTFGGMYLGYAFLLTAFLLVLSEIIAQRFSKKKDVAAGSALGIGVMQVVGMLPGVSRSGATISGGLALGIDRKKAASFSFLMSIPAILGATVLQGYKLTQDSAAVVQWLPTIIGTVCAAVSGYFAIRFMLALIQKKRLYGFAAYVLILGIFVLLDQYLLGMINWALKYLKRELEKCWIFLLNHTNRKCLIR